jgi:hypothetical protein
MKKVVKIIFYIIAILFAFYEFVFTVIIAGANKQNSFFLNIGLIYFLFGAVCLSVGLIRKKGIFKEVFIITGIMELVFTIIFVLIFVFKTLSSFNV